jgi:multicomponent Na+:H+ antiporter subunit D
MAILGIIYALLENDIRRLLGWEIVSQVGYMVTGVGIGTALAINGTAAHAFAHILYKGLLFMAVGSVVYSTGKSKFTELGGLYKRMPLTLFFLLVGSLSVSAFPFLSGFVSKSMIISASFKEHMLLAGFLLTMVSAGTFLVAGLRLPYLLFFGESRCSDDTWEKACDPPGNMLAAMAMSSFFCLLVGCYLPFLYDMLPFHDTHYHPYSGYHLSETLQILALTVVGFYFFKDKITARPTISLDLDWFYRTGGKGFLWLASKPIQALDNAWGEVYRVVGLIPLMTTAKFWGWFDWHGIDGVVDGIARLVRGFGGHVSRILQRGQIQHTLCITITFAAIALFAFAWL